MKVYVIEGLDKDDDYSFVVTVYKNKDVADEHAAIREKIDKDFWFVVREYEVIE